MIEHYLDILQRTILENWDQPALTDFYLTDDGTAQDTSRGNRYTYGEMYGEMMRLGDLFRTLGLQQGDHIAICGSNSANWAVAYLAIAAFKGVAVTVLHTQNIEDIAYQIDFSDSVCLFTDKELWDELVAKDSSPSQSTQQSILQVAKDSSPSKSVRQGIFQSAKDRNPSLLPNIHYVIALDDFSILFRAEDYKDTIGIPKGYNKNDEPADTLNREKTERRPREELMLQLQNSKLSDSKSLDNLAMICFTSGTSGNPKGVMLTYKCISVNTQYLSQLYNSIPKKNAISFLPFSHMGGIILELIQPLYDGESVNITKQPISIKGLKRCYDILAPTIVMMVPGVLYKMLELYPEEQINSLLGSNLYLLGIGGAKLSQDVENRIISENIPLAIGYGTTECGPFISIAMPYCFKSGSAGRLVSSMSCKFSPEGEILVRGENVMLGYYKNPEATAEKIDQDGWLHTGDAGYMDEDGYLYVTGRIGQDMIVLPNGENIHPEDIERRINALPEIAESIVVARDGKLVALVVEIPEILENPEKPKTPAKSEASRQSLSHHILRQINPQLPMYSQLSSVEFLAAPLARTAKQTIKRYLYK